MTVLYDIIARQNAPYWLDRPESFFRVHVKVKRKQPGCGNPTAARNVARKIRSKVAGWIDPDEMTKFQNYRNRKSMIVKIVKLEVGSFVCELKGVVQKRWEEVL